mmetsp:Transcript_75005/g.243796  ORF Transcript_75005/g.243796 Transcript_75005/m.243796 type:complete len:264 (+) Transcript_75005:492-1283(+)
MSHWHNNSLLERMEPLLQLLVHGPQLEVLRPEPLKLQLQLVETGPAPLSARPRRLLPPTADPGCGRLSPCRRGGGAGTAGEATQHEVRAWSRSEQLKMGLQKTIHGSTLQLPGALPSLPLVPPLQQRVNQMLQFVQPNEGPVLVQEAQGALVHIDLMLALEKWPDARQQQGTRLAIRSSAAHGAALLRHRRPRGCAVVGDDIAEGVVQRGPAPERPGPWHEGSGVREAQRGVVRFPNVHEAEQIPQQRRDGIQRRSKTQRLHV